MAGCGICGTHNGCVCPHPNDSTFRAIVDQLPRYGESEEVQQLRADLASSRAEVDRLRTALKHYAKPLHWLPSNEGAPTDEDLFVDNIGYHVAAVALSEGE